MNRHGLYKIGPAHTPPIIKVLLFLTALTSILCAIQLSYFPGFPLYQWIALSLHYLKQGFFWQFLTYIFLVPSFGLTGGFILHLLFNLYLLWLFGEALVTRTSQAKFLVLYLLCGIISGVIATIVMAIGYPDYIMAGSTLVIYGYLVAWVIANPHAELRLFFTIPFKAKWLILGLLGINLLFSLTKFDLVGFFTFLTSSLIGYIFGLLVFNHHGPFAFLIRWEKKLFHFIKKRKEKKSSYHSSKIYDIKTKEQKINDDEFMDAMLAKVSKEGEKSLSRKERKRMRSISKKKKD